LGPIGSAVLAFIGYKQTDRHPDKQSINIDLIPLQPARLCRGSKLTFGKLSLGSRPWKNT